MSDTLARALSFASAATSLFGAPAVLLDTFAFTDFEVPERIRWGGDHAGSLHKLIGGDRVLDLTGPDDVPIEWSGILLGPNAKERARDLNALREYGGPYNLDWRGSSQRVYLRSCTFDEGYNPIQYRIVCEVVSESNNAAADADFTNAAEVKDVARADGALSAIGLSGSFAGLSSVGSAIASVKSAAVSVAAPAAALLGTVQNVTATTGLGGALAAVTTGRDAASALLGPATAPGFLATVSAARDAATLTAAGAQIARAASFLRG